MIDLVVENLDFLTKLARVARPESYHLCVPYYPVIDILLPVEFRYYN